MPNRASFRQPAVRTARAPGSSAEPAAGRRRAPVRGDRGAQRELLVHGGGEAGRAGGDEEAADAVVGVRPHHGDVGDRAVGDPHLGAVEHPVRAVRLACVRMPAGFEPKSGSVRPKQPMASPVAIRGSHSCFCSSEPYRGSRTWPASPAPRPAAHAGVDGLEFEAGQAVRDRAHARAAVALEVHAEHAELAESAASSRTGSLPASNQSAMCGRSSASGRRGRFRGSRAPLRSAANRRR